MNEDNRKVFQVSELNSLLNEVLTRTFDNIWLVGEISNFRVYPSGHCYFTLKDQESQIRAVLFSTERTKFKFQLTDGLQIIVFGRIGVFTPRGEYQFIVRLVEPVGKGALQLAFEQLKNKLDKEGLFRPERKRKIPEFPQRIGIVTSPQGAAIRDILTVLNRRFTNLEILIYPVLVQGTEAAGQIARAIDDLNQFYPELDVLLVGRGGGSLEDLWPFNEELVARAIVHSRIPVISCVGHEIDYTIADYAADLRAPTPSAAAELVVKNKVEIVEKIRSLQVRLTSRVTSLWENIYTQFQRLATSYIFTQPLRHFEQISERIDFLYDKLSAFILFYQKSQQDKLNLYKSKLELLSPLAVLQRGYAIIYRQPENQIVRTVTQVKVADRVIIRMIDGQVTGEIKS